MQVHNSNTEPVTWREWHQQQSMPSQKDRSAHISCTQRSTFNRSELNGVAHSWARCAVDKKARAHFFCVWPSSVSAAPLSCRRSIASPVKLSLLMMGRWGLFVIRYTLRPPTFTPTIHPPDINIPMTLWNNPSTQQRRPGQTEATLHNQYLKLKKREKGESQRKDLGLTTTHLRLTCLLTAGAVCTGGTPIENRWQNWLLLGGRQGQQTRTSRPIEIIEQPPLICLFLSLYLIWRWNQNARHEPVFLSPSHTCDTRGSPRFWCVRFRSFFCQRWPFWRMIFPFLPFLISIEARQSGKWLIKCRPSVGSAQTVVTCDLTDRRWRPVGTWEADAGERWLSAGPPPPLHLHLLLPSSSPFPFFCVVCEMRLPSEWEGISKRLPRRDEPRR